MGNDAYVRDRSGVRCNLTGHVVVRCIDGPTASVVAQVLSEAMDDPRYKVDFTAMNGGPWCEGERGTREDQAVMQDMAVRLAQRRSRSSSKGKKSSRKTQP